MLRLAYLSRATNHFSSEELSGILKVARRKNPLDQITGVLIYYQGSILQILEGEEDKVMECFNRIQKDPRHQDVAIVSRSREANRLFTNWSMGHVDPSEFSPEMRKDIHSMAEIASRMDQVKGREMSLGSRKMTEIIRRFLRRYEISHAN